METVGIRDLKTHLSRHLKRVTLELGGKNSTIVLDDADLDVAASSAAWGAYLHQGQICMATGTVLAQRKIARELTERLVPGFQPDLLRALAGQHPNQVGVVHRGEGMLPHGRLRQQDVAHEEVTAADGAPIGWKRRAHELHGHVERVGDLRLVDVPPASRDAQRRPDLGGAPRRDPPQVQPVPAAPPPSLGDVQRDRARRTPHLPCEVSVDAPQPIDRPPERGDEGEGNFESVKGHGILLGKSGSRPLPAHAA